VGPHVRTSFQVTHNAHAVVATISIKNITERYSGGISIRNYSYPDEVQEIYSRIDRRKPGTRCPIRTAASD
jgi:hypothetical protein